LEDKDYWLAAHAICPVRQSGERLAFIVGEGLQQKLTFLLPGSGPPLLS
jgi:hypothetical protein